MLAKIGAEQIAALFCFSHCVVPLVTFDTNGIHRNACYPIAPRSPHSIRAKVMFTTSTSNASGSNQPPHHSR